MDVARDLIERLCTVAAMIMEDEIEAALVHSPTGALGARIEAISRAGRDISGLAGAAAVIVRRWPEYDGAIINSEYR